MRGMKRMLSLLLLLCLLPALPALAEDVCVVGDGLTAETVTTDREFLRVQCDLPCEGQVVLSVRDEWGYLMYQRNYGVKSGTFRSGDIHLPLSGDIARYTVTLETAQGAHAFTVIREMAMITDSSVFAGGIPLKEMVDGSRHKFAVALDMDALNEETLIVPMLAGGSQVGEVYFSVLDGRLSVTAALLAEGEINKATVYIAPDAITARSLGSSRFTGVKAKLNREIDLGGTPYAAVMVQLTVTYDPATVQAWEMTREEEKQLEELRECWMLMQMMTANEAVG